MPICRGGAAFVWPRPKQRGAYVLNLVRCFARSKSGVTLVEYGVFAAIVAMVIMMAMSTGNS
jgi:hypothetical protein